MPSLDIYQMHPTGPTRNQWAIGERTVDYMNQASVAKICDMREVPKIQTTNPSSAM